MTSALLRLLEAQRMSDDEGRAVAIEVAKTHRAFVGTYYVQTLEASKGYGLWITIRHMIGKVKSCRNR
jgi:hypothetical protein